MGFTTSVEDPNYHLHDPFNIQPHSHYVILGLGNPNLEGMSYKMMIIIHSTILTLFSSILAPLFPPFFVKLLFSPDNQSYHFFQKLSSTDSWYYSLYQYIPPFLIWCLYYLLLTLLYKKTTFIPTLLPLIPYSSLFYHQFSGTRHNIGQDYVRQLAKQWGVALDITCGRAQISKSIDIAKFALQYPHLFSTIAAQHTIPPDQLGVIRDSIKRDDGTIIGNNCDIMNFKKLNQNKPTQLSDSNTATTTENNQGESAKTGATDTADAADATNTTSPQPIPPSLPLPLSLLTKPIYITFAISSTYMNDTGKCVTSLLSRLGVQIEHLIVVQDDMDLPIGTIHLRNKGNGNGHNGVADVVKACKQWDKQTRKYLRKEEKKRSKLELEPNDNEDLNDPTPPDESTTQIAIEEPKFIRFRLGIGRPGEPLPTDVLPLEGLATLTTELTTNTPAAPVQQHKRPKHSVPTNIHQRPKANLREIEKFVLGFWSAKEKKNLFSTRFLFISVMIQLIVLGLDKAQSNNHLLGKQVQDIVVREYQKGVAGGKGKDVTEKSESK
jgi:peptidyl-tRNA hydrolase